MKYIKPRIDLHVHSKYSGDNDAEPEEEILRAIELNLRGIAFTEHYSYEASEPVEKMKEKYGGSILILRGVEWSAEEGHCLIFGVDTDRLDMRRAPVKDLIRAVSAAGGVVIPSHPFRKGNGIGDALWAVNGLCAVEGFNGNNMHTYNAKAVEAARALGLPYTGGSDAHDPREVGSCVTEFDTGVAYDNFVDLLRRGNYRGIDTRRRGGTTVT